MLKSNLVSTWRNRLLSAVWIAASLAITVPTTLADEQPLTIVVMDPLAAPLSCPCVEGYAQRDYEKLAAYLEEALDRPVALHFSESLMMALVDKTEGVVDLVIGKDSVVRADATQSGITLKPLARLSDRDGKTTQTGLVVVRSDDEANQIADLSGYRILFGPVSCSEKHSAVVDLLKRTGVAVPTKIETSQACSDGACKILEWGADEKAAAVISSYAQPLLEGCGTIKQGELRVVGETDPVPFVSAFVNESAGIGAGIGIAAKLEAALAAVAEQADLCTALESRDGFVNYSQATPIEKNGQKTAQAKKKLDLIQP